MYRKYNKTIWWKYSDIFYTGAFILRFGKQKKVIPPE